jgi:mono/diheme cytochrome c family protein
MNGTRSRPAPVREDYSTLLVVGLALAAILFGGLGIYWFGDGARLDAAAASLSQNRVQRGGEIFTTQCAACHGTQGEGGIGPALNNRAVLKNTPDEIFFSVIRSGVPNTQMPSWSVEFGGPLTDEEIHNVVAFLRAWEPTAPEITPIARQPDPAQGALLFSSTCALCHGENGLGGRPGIPALNDHARLAKFDDNWYRSVISYGRPAKGMPTWGTVLAPAQIDDLVALIAAWRAGQIISPAFSITKLLDLALFSLSQGDDASAKLQISRALGISTGPAVDLLTQAETQIGTGDRAGAIQTLTSLKDNWPPGDSQAGSEVYTANCVACHGPNGEGGIGKTLRGSEFVKGQTNADLVRFIQDGRPGTAMAGFRSRLSEQEIANVVAWLRTWQK